MCTFAKFTGDIKMSSVVDKIEGKDAIQRNLGLKSGPMKFKKAKCKLLLLGQGSPKYMYRLWEDLTESCPVEGLEGPDC